MTGCSECGYVHEATAAESVADNIRLETAALAELLLTTDRQRVRQRDRPDLWSPLEYACHVRDVLLTQRERVLLARRVHTPEVVAMGRDERVGHDGYAEQNPAEVAAELTMAARLLANVLERLDGADWDRHLLYNWPERGERTLRWLASHTAHDVHHHLFDVLLQLDPEGRRGADERAASPHGWSRRLPVRDGD